MRQLLNKHTLLTAAFALTLAIVPAACGSDEDSPPATVGTGAPTVPSMPPSSDAAALPTAETAGPLVVGKSEADAQAAVEAAGWTMRVTQRDGEDLAVTADFVENRVNVAVEDGTVTTVSSIG
jgi:hypothetical protein